MATVAYYPHLVSHTAQSAHLTSFSYNSNIPSDSFHSDYQNSVPFSCYQPFNNVIQSPYQYHPQTVHSIPQQDHSCSPNLPVYSSNSYPSSCSYSNPSSAHHPSTESVTSPFIPSTPEPSSSPKKTPSDQIAFSSYYEYYGHNSQSQSLSRMAHSSSPAPVFPPSNDVELPDVSDSGSSSSLSSTSSSSISDDVEDGAAKSKSIPSGKVKKKTIKKKKKAKRDPNEPQKPVSAYALFFRDQQAIIKSSRPEVSFGEISKIVANMWEALDESHKIGYKHLTEAAKKDYLRKLATYKANLITAENPSSSGDNENGSVDADEKLKTVVQKIKKRYSAEEVSNLIATNGDENPEEKPKKTPSVQVIALPKAANSSAPSKVSEPSKNSHRSHYPTPAHLGKASNRCVLDTCNNISIGDPRWDHQYCSTQCCVQHCQEAFQNWVSGQQENDTSLNNSGHMDHQPTVGAV